MARWLPLLLIILVFGPAASPVAAQQPGPAPTNPATPNVTPSGGPAPEAGAPQRGSTFDYVVAFAGVTLVLLVVCYPSRRY